MMYRTLPLGLIVFFGLALAMAPSSCDGAAFQAAPQPGDSTPDVSRIDCSTYPASVTHQFRRDGLAFYAIEGGCRITRLNGNTRDVRFHVDMTWDPKQRVAMEFARIYDLGNALPDLFQPGTPGDPKNFTPFTTHLVCGADPWLNDTQCGLVSLNAGDLRTYVPRLTLGPYPVTKDAIPPAQRQALLAEYRRVIDPIAQSPLSPTVKMAPHVGGQQPPPPSTPAYGATYAPTALTSLTRGQIVTHAVTVTNTGSLT